MKAKWFSSILILALLVMSLVPAAGAAPAFEDDGPIFAGKGDDNLSHPKGDAQAALKAKAMEAQIQGKTKGKTHEVARGQFAELALEKNDRVFVIVAEFGESIHPTYGGEPGPLHNEIAEPNRAVDNTTIWQADFNKEHFEDMYFNQMVDYYAKQSSGRYTINGDVIDWVKVPYNEARYGSNLCGATTCSTVWYLIRDAINQWVADQKAAGMSNQEIYDYLATFDAWDRYDVDGDGNFDEADGYIDHFQIVHAGVGEETGGGAQGEQAIWSHRWYTSYQGIGVWGPPGAEQGGMEFGGLGTFGNEGGPNAVGMWVGDYTIQPENGGLGVFAHEYAHDLGLPDQYDTAGGANSTGFWTIMSSGSYLGDGTTDIGSNPGDFNAWEKFQLGWLDFTVAEEGKKSSIVLGPAETTTQHPQGLFVVLPDKEVTVQLAPPYSGAYFYYSGSGDNLDNSMTRSVTLPGGSVSLSAQVNYQIELDWDYAYLTVNGSPVATNLSTNDNPNGQNFGEGITGDSGGNWVTLTADLSDYAGQTVNIGFNYWSDGAVAELGFMVDDVAISGQPLDDAEGIVGWTFNGFSITTGTETNYYFNAYVAEYRQYRTYDAGLKTGPYNFGFLNSAPDWVEHYPYQDGLLISYWDSSYTDNNTSEHPGGGLILPIDSHPAALMRPDGNPWTARVQAYDSTFTPNRTNGFILHVNGVESPIPSQPGVRLFNDNLQYWNWLTPLAGVINPQTGTQIRVQGVNALGFMQIKVKAP